MNKLEGDNARHTKDRKVLSFVSSGHIETYIRFNETQYETKNQGWHHYLKLQ